VHQLVNKEHFDNFKMHGMNVKISVYVFYLSQKNYSIMPNDFEVCLMLTIKYRVYLFLLVSAWQLSCRP